MENQLSFEVREKGNFRRLRKPRTLSDFAATFTYLVFYHNRLKITVRL